jgi:hypothetical protein
MRVGKLDGKRVFLIPEPYTSEELEIAKQEIKEEKEKEGKK